MFYRRSHTQVQTPVYMVLGDTRTQLLSMSPYMYVVGDYTWISCMDLVLLSAIHNLSHVLKGLCHATVKRHEEEPRFFEVCQNRFLIFMKKDTVVDYKKLL